ncbi:protein ZBED8-like [Photinus pyralis]|uniref:protein ZBED8-like n=1 Tax=Photinus pyralis TaxID=7054 RepID=UPI0012671091|nr:protein ZBED8-like [Photinus pyralis]
MKLKRTKCTQIINNVLCKKETDDLILMLRDQNFSILLDESTDIGDHKSLVILTRYFKNNKIETRLLQLLQLDARKLGADELYQAFVSCLEKHSIPKENIVGVASDGASVMIGKNHSFFKLLKDNIPHVILVRCICHSAALVASRACSELPRSPEDLLRNIYNYVSGSAKRCAELQEIGSISVTSNLSAKFDGLLV